MNLFFDTETTGLPYGKPLEDPAYPWPVEIAAILATPKNETVSSFRVIIKPDGWVIPEVVTKIHNISESYATRYGMDLPLALTIFEAYLQQADTVLAWNISFDAGIIKSAALRLKTDNPLENQRLTDLMHETSAFLGLGRMSLTKAYDWMFKRPVPQAHTAMGDALACQAIWKKISRQEK